MAEDELILRPQPPRVAIVPSPGIGHLIPLGEFARRLADDHGAVVTFITLSAGAPSAAQLAYIAALPTAIRSVQLPPVDVSDLPANSIETVISVTVVRSLPALRDALRPLAATAIVVDLFCTPAFDVAKELQVRPYIFYPPNATVLSFFLHLPELDEATSGEYRDLPEPLRLPGCPAFSGADLLEPVQDRSADNYKWVLRHCRRYRDAAGIFVNTFADLEPGPLTALRSKVPTFPPVHPIGPVIRSSSGGGGGVEILKWLDEQPVGSVLYVSFGSGGTLTAEQMAELAAGLELSEQRFLWVARSPSETESGATFFTVDSANDPLCHLPEGFLRRTKSSALVVPSWAPQIQVLGHPATAGFLTHCGWNSVLESISKGVPLIAWPLYAEQKMNAVMLSDEIGVALRPAAATGAAVVGREEVARVVKALVEGEEGKRVRSRVRMLMECGSRAVVPGGSSYDALAGVVSTWKEINSGSNLNNNK